MAPSNPMRRALHIFIFALGITLVACGGEVEVTGGGHDDHDHRGQHGGNVVEVGGAHLEFVHDHDNSAVRIFLTGEDAVTPLAADSEPELRLVTAEGPRVLGLAAVDGEPGTYVVSDPALATDPLEGILKAQIAGDEYPVDLDEVHDHDHE